jgi:hypothetical protein
MIRSLMSTGSTMLRAALEQRSSPRRTVLLRCRIDGSSTDGVERHTRIADLATGGARIFTASPPALGEILTVSFRLTDAGPQIDTQARVVWRSEGFRGRGGVIGVEFVTVSDPDALARHLGEG